MTLIQRAIQIYQQTLGVEHPNTKAAMSWLPLIKEKVARLKGKRKWQKIYFMMQSETP